MALGWSFTNGGYSSVLRQSFGDDAIYSGFNYFVLPNAWAHVESNGLSVKPDRVRYVVMKSGVLKKLDFSTTECVELKPLVDLMYEQLSTVYEYASGKKKYDSPSYLDGPDFVLEYHGKNADLVIEPKGLSANFPLVVTANEIIGVITGC